MTPLDLAWVRDSRIMPGTKGVPPDAIGSPLFVLSTGDAELGVSASRCAADDDRYQVVGGLRTFF